MVTPTSPPTLAPSIPAQARIGHVHLKVADLDRAVRFYHKVLGFDLVLNLGTAAFVSAGGYHHHIGLNTWESEGPLPGLARTRLRPPESLIRQMTRSATGNRMPIGDD